VVTTALLPLLYVAVAVNACVAPCTTDALAGVTNSETGFKPVPLRLVICGLFEALSVKVRVPVRVPVAFGENTM
jgi:hypothetical protein